MQSGRRMSASASIADVAFVGRHVAFWGHSGKRISEPPGQLLADFVAKVFLGW